MIYDAGLTELATNQTISFPVNYSLIMSRADGSYEYLPGLIDMEGFVKEKRLRDFIFQLEDYSWKGELSERSDMLMSQPGYPVFMELAAGTNYETWIFAVLHNKNPYLKDFRIIDGKIKTYAL